MFDINLSYLYISIPVLLSLSCYTFREKIWNHIWNTPGVGKLTSRRDRKTKKNILRVETDSGTINLPTFYVSNASEIEIGFFDFPVVEKDMIITKKEFKEKYSMYDLKFIPKHGRHFILPFFHTNLTKEGKVSFVISSLTEMNVYIFTIDNNFIDLSSYYNQFLVLLKDFEEDLLLLNGSPS